METPYKKPHLNFAEQIALLKSRGLAVTDDAIATSYLERVGYYRLRPYWSPFMIHPEKFGAGVEFRHAVQLYVFDKKLRLLFLDAIERIEVAIRVDLAHRIGRRDSFGHRSEQYLDLQRTSKVGRTGETRHQEWLARADKIEADSKEHWVSEFRGQFTGNLPIVMAVELWDFGTVSKLLQMTHLNDRYAIAKKYNIQPDTLISWVRCLNYVRNACAHHARLWNKPLVDQPMIPKVWEAKHVQHVGLDVQRQSRIYGAAAITRHLLTVTNPQSELHRWFKAHWITFPIVPSLGMDSAGFFQNWENERLWL